MYRLGSFVGANSKATGTVESQLNQQACFSVVSRHALVEIQACFSFVGAKATGSVQRALGARVGHTLMHA